MSSDYLLEVMGPELCEFVLGKLGPDVLVERRMYETEIQWVSIELPQNSYECWVVRNRQDEAPDWHGDVVILEHGKVNGVQTATLIDIGDLASELRGADAESIAVAAVERLRSLQKK